MDQKVSASDIVVSDEAFKFLRLQKGKLEPLSRVRPRWLEAYRGALQQDYDLMRPHLPELDPDRMHMTLDVGSGLGGINILLHRHYAESIVPCLMDGANDLPEMTLHRKTYSNAKVAQAFLADNGVGAIGYSDANARPLVPPAVAKYALVISLGSWCFHYSADTYLDYVVACVAPGARIIVDVRKDKPEWRAALNDKFSWRGSIHTSTKFDRMVFDAN